MLSDLAHDSEATAREVLQWAYLYLAIAARAVEREEAAIIPPEGVQP